MPDKETIGIWNKKDIFNSYAGYCPIDRLRRIIQFVFQSGKTGRFIPGFLMRSWVDML